MVLMAIALYVMNRWIVGRYNKKPALKGIWGVLENGIDRWHAEDNNLPKILTALIVGLLFLVILAGLTFEVFPKF